ncbi:MAG: acylneuraminate cytidylyltransferase family protein [Magnetospirillum sp.]|nr:acylneuraminate cytidylyltransferase family protein [Magnetospirillum sp.]
MTRILAVITARGGSKGVPRKNVRLLAGRPLVAHAVETALAVKHRLHRIVVSTDDDEIAAAARAAGAEVPFRRPAELSGDLAPSLPVLQHAVSCCEADDGHRLDWVLLLQPTSPLRLPADVEHCIDLALSDPTADSVISLVEVVSSHPVFVKRLEHNLIRPFVLEEHEGLRRQDRGEPAYIRNGAVYLTRRDIIMGGSIWGKRSLGYVMPDERSVNIDSGLEFRLAELLLAERKG